MVITKTKGSNAYNLFSLSEIKEYGGIAADDSTYDSILRRLIKTSVDECEDFIGDDIAITTSVLQVDSFLTPFFFTEYEVPKTNITITSITKTVNGVTSTVSASTYSVEKYSNYTLIRFDPAVTGDVLKINYTSGYSTSVPETIKQAVAIRVFQHLDKDEKWFVNDTKTFERLLYPFKTLY